MIKSHCHNCSAAGHVNYKHTQRDKLPSKVRDGQLKRPIEEHFIIFVSLFPLPCSSVEAKRVLAKLTGLTGTSTIQFSSSSNGSIARSVTVAADIPQYVTVVAAKGALQRVRLPTDGHGTEEDVGHSSVAG